MFTSCPSCPTSKSKGVVLSSTNRGSSVTSLVRAYGPGARVTAAVTANAMPSVFNTSCAGEDRFKAKSAQRPSPTCRTTKWVRVKHAIYGVLST